MRVFSFLRLLFLSFQHEFPRSILFRLSDPGFFFSAQLNRHSCRFHDSLRGGPRSLCVNLPAQGIELCAIFR